jgi:microcystin-dependent protein
MSEPFLSEIKIMSFNFPPKGWAFCNGQTLPINQNQALFALLGTTYGGNGQTTFQLPNLRGQVPIGVGNGHTLGEKAGQTAHTVIISELPQHIHFVQASTQTQNTSNSTSNAFLAPSANTYAGAANLTSLLPASVLPVGGSQPHVNMMPYTVLNFCIALQGIFPSQN